MKKQLSMTWGSCDAMRRALFPVTGLISPDKKSWHMRLVRSAKPNVEMETLIHGDAEALPTPALKEDQLAEDWKIILSPPNNPMSQEIVIGRNGPFFQIWHNGKQSARIRFDSPTAIESISQIVDSLIHPPQQPQSAPRWRVKITPLDGSGLTPVTIEANAATIFINEGQRETSWKFENRQAQ